MTGIVLAGGQSKRMGTAKALLRLGDETLADRAVGKLREFCKRIIVVSDPRAPLAEIPGCAMVTDETPGLGPLGGIVSALGASNDEWHLALACDLPLARAEVLRLLVSETGGEVDAVVSRAGGRLQPLIAVYSHTCLEAGRSALDAGGRAVTAMLDRVRVKIVEEERLREVDPELVSFVNVNTWDDYQQVLQREQQHAG